MADDASSSVVGHDRTAEQDGTVEQDGTAAPDHEEPEIVVVTMRFDAADDAALLAVLSKYVVLTRMELGCRNIDLCSSVTRPGRHLVIQKWESVDAQRAHFDTDLMVEMASSCDGILRGPPDIDLWDGASVHDLA